MLRNIVNYKQIDGRQYWYDSCVFIGLYNLKMNMIPYIYLAYNN